MLILEKYTEYIKCTCEHCEICPRNNWVGPLCPSDGFHYLHVKSTPTEVDGQPRLLIKLLTK